MRLNARGVAGLLDGKSPGQPAKLNDVQREATVRMIESGPIRRSTAWGFVDCKVHAICKAVLECGMPKPLH